MTSPRVSVPWRDLLPLSRREVLAEASLSLPWLAASLVLAANRWHGAALGGSFMFFLTGLRQVHGAFHYSLGLPQRWTEGVMFALSAVMLGSMHPVQTTHLLHHRVCLGPGDIEAHCARLPAWKAILTGPLFPLRLHAAAFRLADRRRRSWILAELGVTALVVTSAVATDWWWLRYHVIAMAAGHCLSSFFAVWTVHHDCEGSGSIARTMRGPVRTHLTYAMFYHLEHHLFPAVPTRRLPELARRLGRVAPDLVVKRVL